MKHSVELIKLKNGVEGLLLDAPDASVVYFDIAFRAGNYLSPKNKMDTAHIMEHMVLGANEKYKTAKDFSIEVSRNGAYTNAYTGDYHMGYIAECAEFEAIRILDLLMIAIEAPLFSEKDFQSELSNVREELNMRRNYHELELSLELDSKLGLVSQSYTHRISQLDNIELKDILNHYQRTHFSNNMRFIIAGPLAKHRQAIINRLEETTLSSGDGLIGLPEEKARSFGEPLEITRPGIENVYYKWLTITKGHLTLEERVGLYGVFDYLFSTFHSKVFGQAREEGLIYGIDPSYFRTRDNELIGIAGQVQQKNLKPLFKLINKEFDELINKGINNKEIEQLKSYQFGTYQKMIQTVRQLANWYENYYISTDRVYSYQEFAEYLKGLKADDVNKALSELFNPQAWGMGFMSETKINPEAQEIYSLVSANYN